MLLSQSPADFLERSGIRITSRKSTPVMRDDYTSMRRPLKFPLPLPELSLTENGSPPPDRVVTEIWPHKGS